MMEFRNKNIEVFPYSNDTYSIVVFNPRLAAKLNKTLKYYPADAKFIEGDEILFRVSSNRIELILLQLKVPKSFLKEQLRVMAGATA